MVLHAVTAVIRGKLFGEMNFRFHICAAMIKQFNMIQWWWHTNSGRGKVMPCTCIVLLYQAPNYFGAFLLPTHNDETADFMKKIAITTKYRKLLSDVYTPVGIYLRPQGPFPGYRADGKHRFSCCRKQLFIYLHQRHCRHRNYGYA